MGQLSTFGAIASFVLLMQLGLHTQLLRRRSGMIEYSNYTDEDLSMPLNSPAAPSLPNRIFSVISSSASGRNKRFLSVPQANSNENSVEGDTTSALESSLSPSLSSSSLSTSTAVDVPEPHTESTSVVVSRINDPWEGVSPDLLIKNYYTGNYILPNEQLCKKKKEKLSLLVLVPSAVSNFRQRDSVRKTWGSFALRRDVAVGFVVGDPRLTVTNNSILESFRREIDLFEDIIIADFKDSYRNLTLKALYMADWSSKYCSNARFFMKTDDDVFLNVPLVLDFIANVEESDSVQPKIYGNVFSGHLPKRNTSHKHYVNYQVYPHELHYPNFTSGPAYLISSKVLKPLLKEAVKLPLFNLEDVLLTGFAASKLNIPRVNVTQFRNELENPFDMPACKVVNTIAGMTDGSSSQIYHVWYNYLMGRLICPHLRKQQR